MLRLILTLLLVSLLLVQGETRRKKPTLEEQQPAVEEQATVVEANHFYSQTKTSTSLEIGQSTKDKPMVFLLEPSTGVDQSKTVQTFNPITATISSGNEKQTCTISHYFGMCELPKVTTEKPSLSIECKQAPCDIRWELVQPQTVEIDGNHSLNHLVSINKDKNHAILKVFCSDPALKEQVKTAMQLYTNSNYEKILSSEGEVLYLFNNEEKGRYYMTTKNLAVQKCAEVTLQHATEEIQLKPEGYMVYDFLSNREQNEYALTSAPKTDFLIEVLAHNAAMEQLTNSSGITVKFVGLKGKDKVDISFLTLNVDSEKSFIDFSAAFKKPTASYDSYELHLKGLTQNYLITTITAVASEILDVQFQEESYFDLKKGEKLSYHIQPLDKKITNIKTLNIELSNSTQFKVSKDSCPRDGCQFTVEAMQDAQGSVYIGEDRVKKAAETVLQQFEKAIGSKLREGEEKFYLYKMKKDTSVQFLVNTPNVIVYLADKEKCPAPKLKECSEKQFSYHHPTIYEAKEDVELVIKVVALDSCYFVVTALESSKPYIELKDSEPFVYLLDDNEPQLIFHFKLNSKEDVSFNLISGLNELELFVFNQETLSEDSTKQATDSSYSMEGFLCFAKEDITANDFVIKVQKREEYHKKFVHFTLIASTKTGNLRLEPGNAHYQTLKPKGSREYVLQVQEDKKMFLNFYTHNLQKVDLIATVSRTDQYTNKSATAEQRIDRQTDVIGISLLAQKLCGEDLSDCEIFVRLENRMSMEADVTLTLMVRDVVVELKDGIWQTYDINEAASTAHFYFLPKHQKHSIAIFYHSYNVDLRLTYRLWKSDDTSIAISEWPFPTNFNLNDTAPSRDGFRPTRFIHIQNRQLKECWPDCVVLLSLFPDKKQLQSLDSKPMPFFNSYHNFKLMASNNLVEIPQKFKLDMVLNEGEEKYMLVDLKYFMSKESLVFFTYTSMGSVSFKANLYTEKNPHCPSTQDANAEYHLYGIETEITLESIKNNLQTNGMDSDKSPYLCILATAYVESKFSIDFVSQINSIKDIPLDTTTPVKMSRDQTRIFQINAHFKFFVKISRTNGFPFISKKICSPVDNMEQCLEDFKNNQEKGEMLANKITSISEQPCVSCMLYIKIYAREEVAIMLHAQSVYAQIDLKESQPLTDTLATKQVNRYLITSTKHKEIVINVHILSGNLRVKLYDYQKVSLSKENPKGSNNIQIVVPSADLNSEKKVDPAAPYSYNAFALSSFVNLHLLVKSQEAEGAASYILTYSNGEASTYLQDGLISEYNLLPSKTSKFLYNTPNYGQPIYLYISTPEALSLKNLHPKIFGLQNEGDETMRMEITPQKAIFNKKTVNPTMLLHFTGKSHYRIEIENKNNKDVLLTIGINSRQIVYLPLNHQFPFKLMTKEYIYIVIPVTSPGYLKFTLNKCDNSQPYIAYTDDYRQFLDQEFQSEEQLTDQLTYQNLIKVKAAGSVYLKVRAGDNQTSVLTVKATFDTNKVELAPAKAGDRGNLQYQLLQSTKAEITFSPVVCEQKCVGTFTYSAVASPNIQQIYAHLVCTAVSFDFLNTARLQPPQLQPITAPKSSSKITFQHTLSQGVEYIGVKAVNSKTGEVVHYHPVQLINLTGKLNKAMTAASQDNNPYWIIGTLIVGALCWVLIAYRRWKKGRSGYREVEGFHQNDD